MTWDKGLELKVEGSSLLDATQKVVECIGFPEYSRLNKVCVFIDDSHNEAFEVYHPNSAGEKSTGNSDFAVIRKDKNLHILRYDSSKISQKAIDKLNNALGINSEQRYN
jgi:hypothetical protein